MESPIAGLIPEIFLNHIENGIITKSENNMLENIVSYHRYVDEIWEIINGNERQAKLITEKHSQSLKLSNEIETNKSINILDVRITRTKPKLESEIYRKPTATDHTFITLLITLGLITSQHTNQWSID